MIAIRNRLTAGLLCAALLLVCLLSGTVLPAAAETDETLTVTPAGVYLDNGQTQQLTVSAAEPLGSVTWSSSDPQLLTIDETGLATAGDGDGVVTVTAETEDGQKGTATVTVFSQPNLLTNGDFEQDSSVGWDNITAIKDGVGEYGSRGLEFNGRVSVYYKLPIPLKPATTYVMSYRYKAEKGASFRVYAVDLGAGQLRPSVYVPEGEDIADAEWQTASSVFTTAEYYDPELYWCLSISGGSQSKLAYMDHFTIREMVTAEPVATMTLDQQTLTLSAGRSAVLTPITTPQEADLNALEWTSSDEDVAYVVSGQVMGVGEGIATITATAKSGVTASCAVTVEGNPTLVKNGTFEKEESWTLAGNAVYAPGEGLHGTTGLKLSAPAEGGAPGSVAQQITGLEPNTAYQVQFRFRRRTKDTYAKVTVTQGSAVLGEGIFGGPEGSVSYKAEVTKVDFRTPARLTEPVTLKVALTNGEYVTMDQLIITQAASDIDLVIPELTWMPDDADQVTPGTAVTFVVPIANHGVEGHTQDKPITVDVMVDAQVVTTLTYTEPLPANEIVVLTVPEENAWIATEGDHTITARVNSTLTILEGDESNNYISRNLRVAKQEEFVTAPAAALDKGYNRLVFSDHFDSTATIDTTASGNHGYKWYITRPWGEATLTAEDYRVENGVLYLTTDDTKWNYSMCTIDAATKGVGFAFNKGYLEIRVRMKSTAEGGTVTKIRVPAVWSLSTSSIWQLWKDQDGETRSGVELDWFEYWGNKYGDLRFDVTLHHTVTDRATDEQISHVTVGQHNDEPMGDYQWHTYGMSWSDGVLKTYFDGKYLGKITYNADGYPDPMPKETVDGGLGLREGLFAKLDEQMMPIILGGASDFPLEVDWIHVWQSDGTVEPTPEPDEETEWFMEDYLTDDHGDWYTALTVNNYTDILAGESKYNALTPAQQADVDRLLGVSYMKWVAQAHDAVTVAENFVSYYASAEDGTPYTVIDETNYEWIRGARTEWDTLSRFVKAIINRMVNERSGMTFTVMLEQAQDFVYVPPEPEMPADTGAAAEPDDAGAQKNDLTWLWITLGVVGGIVVIGGATVLILLFLNKKKKM